MAKRGTDPPVSPQPARRRLDNSVAPLSIPGLQEVPDVGQSVSTPLDRRMSTPIFLSPVRCEEPPDLKAQRRYWRSQTPESDQADSELVVLPSRYNSELFIVRELGRGSYSQVFECRHAGLNQAVAVKQLYKECLTHRGRESVLREVSFLAAMAGRPHIVKYLDAWFEEGRLNIMFEYCNGGVVTCTEGWTADGVEELLWQVTLGLNLVHEAGFVHLDIKPDNILLDSSKGFPVYKLSDFGLIRRCNGERHIDEEGDSKYLCLHLLQGGENLKAADVFSLGATAYELARGRQLPGNGEEWIEVRQGKFPEEMADLRRKGHPQEMCELLQSCMRYDADKRPSTLGVLQSSAFRARRGECEETRAAENRIKKLEAELAALEGSPRSAQPPPTPKSPTMPSTLAPGVTSFHASWMMPCAASVAMTSMLSVIARACTISSQGALRSVNTAVETCM